MTLLSQHEAAVRGNDFTHRVTAAIWEECLSKIANLTLSVPIADAEKREARTIRDFLRGGASFCEPVIRLLVSNDVLSASTDAQIQAAISNNWAKIVLLFDPNLDS